MNTIQKYKTYKRNAGNIFKIKLKTQFDKLCSELGLTMTTAFNIFAKTMVRCQAIPFDVALNIPNTQTIKAIKDVENGISYSIPYTTGKNATKMILEGNNED